MTTVTCWAAAVPAGMMIPVTAAELVTRATPRPVIVTVDPFVSDWAVLPSAPATGYDVRLEACHSCPVHHGSAGSEE